LSALGSALAATPISSAELRALLQGLVVEESHIRSAVLQALEPIDIDAFGFLPELWAACHDMEERNVKMASQIQAEQEPEISAEAYKTMLPFLESRHAAVRTATAKSLGTLASIHPERISAMVQELIDLYNARNVELKPELDAYGLVLEASLNREDPWKARCAIMESFGCLSPTLGKDNVLVIFELFLNGNACADRHAAVRQRVLDVSDLRGRLDFR
jgi:hypothetical protein